MKKDHRKKIHKTDVVSVVWHDLKALLFWASVGVRHSVDGAYPEIVDIIHSYGEHVGMNLYDNPPVFGADRPEKRKPKRVAGRKAA